MTFVSFRLAEGTFPGRITFACSLAMVMPFGWGDVVRRVCGGVWMSDRMGWASRRRADWTGPAVDVDADSIRPSLVRAARVDAPAGRAFRAAVAGRLVMTWAGWPAG